MRRWLQFVLILLSGVRTNGALVQTFSPGTLNNSAWVYSFNDRNEVTGGGRFWSDWSPVAGQQFGYDYDNIGNRKTALSGGDTNGVNLRRTGYAANSLNQYTTITNLGYEDIVGVAFATNSVSVNTLAADRKGEYFHREITVTNGAGPVWCGVTVTSGSVSSNGGFVFPANQQALTCDLDGNLTFDGIWNYEWDGENRLKSMTMTNVSGVLSTNRFKLEFTYDSQGRRVQKIVSTNSTGNNFVVKSTARYVYDGWNLIAALGAGNLVQQSFLWGQDLSGTMTEAGGIGGLLAVMDHNGSGAVTEAHFCSYDGNGNVTALTRASDLQTTARYEYSVFGETLRLTGLLAKFSPFRFSTKFADDETGLTYYGYRYYSPVMGRWINRDPMEEQGGLNLLAFVLNSPTTGIDTLGGMMVHVNSSGVDIHDTVSGRNLAYGLDADGEAFWGYERRGHIGQAPEKLVERSILEGLTSKESGLNRLLAKTQHGLREGFFRGDTLARVMRIRATATRMLRNFTRRGGGAVLGAVAILSVATSGAQAAEKAYSYGKNAREGNIGFRDLDAVDIAVSIQEASGNYFVTMWALDILLSDGE